MTLEEWSELDEDAPGELVNGLLEEEEVTTTLHELVAAYLLATLFTQLLPRGGLALGAESKIRTGDRTGRKPDVSVYFPGATLPGKHAKLAKTPPSTLIEVLTPTPRDEHRDRVTKRAEYSAAGVPFYWIVDPEDRVVEVLQLEGDAYAPLVVASGGVLPVPGCEDVTVDLDALWAGADKLPDDGPPSSRRRKKVAPHTATQRRARRPRARKPADPGSP